jgi:hypothetical protein
MKINGLGSGSAPSRTDSVRPSAADMDTSSDEIRVGAVDRAEISSEGMSRAREALEAQAVEVGMEQEHFELIQTRIDSGFYSQPDVVDEIARRIVTSGDI